MTLRFPRLATAQTNYAATLAAWGNPTPINYAEAFAEVQIVRRWAMRSPTAQTIIKKIDTSGTIINVVIFDGNGETVFSSDDPPGQGQGTIFWDRQARFQTKQSGGTTEALHHYIAFLHEMGHAVQWIECPGFFNGNMLHGTASRKTIADGARAFWRKKAEKQGIKGYGSQNAFADTQMGGKAGLVVPVQWKVAIEMDNLRRHEWPICDEARYVRRALYGDLIMNHDSSLFAV